MPSGLQLHICIPPDYSVVSGGFPIWYFENEKRFKQARVGRGDGPGAGQNFRGSVDDADRGNGNGDGCPDVKLAFQMNVGIVQAGQIFDQIETKARSLI